MTAGVEFEWRPGAPRRKRSALLAVPVLAACAAAGAGLSWLLPIERLVVAIERNGVPLPPAEPTGMASAPVELPPISATAPSVSPQPERPPQVVVINSGTARAVDLDEPMSAPARAEVEQRRPVTAIAGQSAPRTTVPPSARHRNSSERRVLVVVRRTGPPYDTKILRGRMSNGRLIVDGRDRRGLIIR
jgi:hypothetical protein